MILDRLTNAKNYQGCGVHCEEFNISDIICRDVWAVPSSEISLFRDDVHLWLASSKQGSGCLQYMQSLLVGDEILRAKKFFFEEDRRRYIISRGFLRIILGRYLDIEPKELCFSYNSYNKPLLEGTFLGDYIRFNLSHSGDLILYAITLGREVGVDIEKISFNENADDIVDRFFSEEEKEDFRHLSHDLRQEAFFKCWTRKEAYIKARGKGMTIPLDGFSVSLLPDEEPALKYVKGNEDEVKRCWAIKDVIPGDGYVSAVATEGDGMNYRYWQCHFEQ